MSFWAQKYSDRDIPVCVEVYCVHIDILFIFLLVMNNLLIFNTYDSIEVLFTFDRTQLQFEVIYEDLIEIVYDFTQL